MLGERHPDTLSSLLHLGMVRYLLGDAAAVDSVRRASRELRQILGPLHFEVWHGWAAQTFTHVPAPALRSFLRLSLFLDGNAQRAADRARRIFGRASG